MAAMGSKMKKFLIALFLFMLPTIAFAQNNGRNPCYYLTPTSTNCIPVSPTTPLPTGSGAGGVAGTFTPLTPMQSGLTVAASTALTVPSGATYAVVCARSQNVSYTTDGTTTPTASVGMQLLQNQCVSLAGATVVSNFRAIQQAATATLDVSYYK